MSDVPSGETTAIRCLRADSRLLGQLDFGGMKRCEFWRAKRAENFPHNPTCFPHNQHFLPHNVPENFHIICYFFPHPIRCPDQNILCGSRKYPYLLTEGICPMTPSPPHPSGNSNLASYIALNFWIFETPPSSLEFPISSVGRVWIFFGTTHFKNVFII